MAEPRRIPPAREMLNSLLCLLSGSLASKEFTTSLGRCDLWVGLAEVKIFADHRVRQLISRHKKLLIGCIQAFIYSDNSRSWYPPSLSFSLSVCIISSLSLSWCHLFIQKEKKKKERERSSTLVKSGGSVLGTACEMRLVAALLLIPITISRAASKQRRLTILQFWFSLV